MRNQYKIYRKAFYAKLKHKRSRHAGKQALDLDWMGAILWFSISTAHKDPFKRTI